MKKVSILLLPILASTLAGCVSLNEEKITSDTPVQLHPAAATLKGAEPIHLMVESQVTVTDIPMRSRTVQRVAGAVDPAVVSIYVKTETPVKVRLIPIKFSFTGIPAKLPGIGLGSGFFIHPNGYLLTNEHVIRNSTEIRVMTSNGTDYIARVVATDPVYDLALLKIDSPNHLKFAFIPMGDSSQVAAGDIAIAVDNPLGFGHTVTTGIISHTGRSLFEEQEENGRYTRYLQTDAAINPGSSGGPLLTIAGAWVGINTAQIKDTQGIGFSVPSALVKEFIGNVLEGEGARVE